MSRFGILSLAILILVINCTPKSERPVRLKPKHMTVVTWDPIFPQNITPESSHGILEGYVRESVTLKPLSGVMVKMKGVKKIAAMSNDSGYYRFPAVVPQPRSALWTTFRFSFAHKGHRPVELKFPSDQVGRYRFVMQDIWMDKLEQ